MESPIKPEKINLNQNLWALLISYGFLGTSEYYDLKTLYTFSYCISIITSISYAITLIPYTIRYWKNKMKN